MKNLGVPYAVGYILAGVVLLPLLIFAVNKFVFQGNKVTENLINNYVENSTKIPVVIDLSLNKPKFTINDFKKAADGKDDTYGSERYTAFLAKGGGKIYISKLTFYVKEYNKFFSIRLTNMNDHRFYISKVIQHIDNRVIITVNNDDLSNIKIGTKDSPIPVFQVAGDKRPLTIDDKSYDITESQYIYSVEAHLKYVMSKEEFKERFEKNK